MNKGGSGQESSLRQLLQNGQERLAASGAGNARLEAEILLAHALDCDRAWLYTHPESSLNPEQNRQFLRLLDQRTIGQPIAYLTGRQEFWSLDLMVNPSVLIPRPETELLVEAALARVPRGSTWRVADLGTGSGAIALAIASERPRARIFASDCSEDALKVAGANADRLGLSVTFAQGHWAEPFDGPFDVLLSNPPYVDQADKHLQQGDLRFEPEEALTPGSDALMAFREITEQALDRLNAGGWLMFEHGFNQASKVSRIMAEAGFEQVETLQDLERRPRVTLACLPQSG